MLFLFPFFFRIFLYYENFAIYFISLAYILGSAGAALREEHNTNSHFVHIFPNLAKHIHYYASKSVQAKL